MILFIGYAASFLYFFVDDEAIPFVYGRNLLRGHGLTYTVLEGPVEGYSDFLHILQTAVMLAMNRVARLPLPWLLGIGKAVSFAAGVGIVLITARMLRSARVTAAGLGAGMAVVAMAGPLAVWSCSSLEAVPFALVVTALVWLLVVEPGLVPPAAVVLLASVAVLQRIDGFVYVGCVLLVAIAASDGASDWRLGKQIVLPIVLVTVAYHLARFAYFGSLLPAPLESKVLYKLMGQQQVLVKAPTHGYLVQILRVYGVAAVPALAMAMIAAARSRVGLTTAGVFVLIAIYAEVVGDWMFGWRFLIPLAPLAAVIVGVAVSRAGRPIAIAAAVVAVAWSGIAASRFIDVYRELERRPIWWTHPNGGLHAWLAPTYTAVEILRPLVKPGDRIADNQAGLLPFLLDLENIDDLGICSRFLARLPTTDVYFTEVGRYTPATDDPVVRTAQAYELYHDIQWLVIPSDLVMKANDGRLPERLIGGYFKKIGADSHGDAVYSRTERSSSRYRTDPRSFQENLAHYSRLREGAINGRPHAHAALGPRLPCFREKKITLHPKPESSLSVRFADHDEYVERLYIDRAAASQACHLEIALKDVHGREVARTEAALSRTVQRFDVSAGPAQASRLDLRVTCAEPNARVDIADVRVLGQSRELGAYVRRMLPFPAP